MRPGKRIVPVGGGRPVQTASSGERGICPTSRAQSWLRPLLMLPFVLAALAGCNPFDRGSSWHQRLVLEVETPDGVVSGGSVVATRIWKGWALGDANGMLLSDIKGEASFVEVAPEKYLFALLSDSGTPGLALELFFSDPKPSVWERAEMLERMTGEEVVVPSAEYPQLVTFTDVNDPTSVQLVDPADLAATFGAGFKLRQVALTITDEGVTEGPIGRILNWLSEYPEPGLCPVTDRLDPPLCRRIKHGNFQRN
jgi:hypothetical protein